MENSNLNYVKTIIRSVVTSTPNNMTIEQVLLDYVDLEGVSVPYKKLGFETVFELLETMNDVLLIPNNPCMSSPIKLITDEKTSHLRELIVNQKSKKSRKYNKRNNLNSNYTCKTNTSDNYSTNNHKLLNCNSTAYNYDNSASASRYNFHKTSVSNYNGSDFGTYVDNFNARGYDYVYKRTSNSQKGYVTNKLKKCIENLCNNSKVISIPMLKAHLISHPDYKKLNSSNIEEAINKLKYFIYIDKGGVHLKNSPYEIFSNTNSNAKDEELSILKCLENIIDQNEEISFLNDDTDDENDYGLMEDLITNNEDINNSSILDVDDSGTFKIIKGNIDSSNVEKVNGHVSKILDVDDSGTFKIKKGNIDSSNVEKVNGHVSKILDVDDSDTFKTKKKNIGSSSVEKVNGHVSKILHLNDSDTSKIQKKNIGSSSVEEVNGDILNIQQKSVDLLKTPRVKPVNNIKSEYELKNDPERKLIIKSSEKDGIDYISMIISIIESSVLPMTVIKLMDTFKNKHNYCFPYQKFGCRSSMDFFRLHPSIFKLDNEYSTNSIIKINREKPPKPQSTFRENFCEASIFKNDIGENSDGIDLLMDYISELNLVNNDVQDHSNNKVEPTNLIRSYEIFDSENILDSMKVKMRSILKKHENGILCNEFMDVYADEYQSSFMFSDYGFKSMRDMAYKLPSVFYVKLLEEEDDDECILFSAYRRVEFENNSKDPSLFYKNIPKTVLNNLSIFFDKNRAGVKLNELMKFYCRDFGRSYEPLKYGYSSEKHMFESLDKMVEIRQNVLYTVDPFAYRYFVKTDEHTDTVNNTAPALPINNYLLNYSGNDVCNGKFQYTELEVPDHTIISVVAAEIYNPSMFYVNLASNVDTLNNMMEELQTFYESNESKYQVYPELLIPQLVCTSRFEKSPRWHRAKILKIVDDFNVEVSYVDFGTTEIIKKTEVRLLEQKFGYMPMQGIFCCLFDDDDDDDYKYDQKINTMFASLIDDHRLEAYFKSSNSKIHPGKRTVSLYLTTGTERIDINEKCAQAIQLNADNRSIRRIMTKIS